jgi:predicted DsbA family dithiol-disulfide isomerase
VRIDQLRRNFEIQTQWIAFPLHPDTPEEGLSLKELYAARGTDIESAKRRLKQAADELGLPLGDRKMRFNSRLAQELAKWAESRGKGDEFHDAAFRAYFVDGKNIGKVDVLADLAKSAGLSDEEARTVLKSRTFRNEVDSDWARSYELGITAVPTFVINGEAVVGALPYEVLEQLMENHGVKKRRATTG